MNRRKLLGILAASPLGAATAEAVLPKAWIDPCVPEDTAKGGECKMFLDGKVLKVRFANGIEQVLAIEP